MSQNESTPTKQEDIQSLQKPQQNSAEKTQSSKSNPFEEYKFIQEIGCGSFGKVYKARKLSDQVDKFYAIKRIKIQLLEQEMKTHQIFMEKLQVFFDFPGIPKMHQCFSYQGSFFFVMEFAQGGPFEQFLRFNSNGSLNFKVIQFYVAEMILILEYLHLQGLAHRDFKPENMVISQNKHLQLIDFGTLNDFSSNLVPQNLKMDILKKNEVKAQNLKKKGIIIDELVEEGEQQKSDQKSSFLQLPNKSSGFFKYDEEQVQNLSQMPDQQTDFDNGITYLASPLPVSRKRLTTFCGTNDYLSPEMLQEQKCDMNGDLWALGCIIYQMFCEKTPFHQKQASYDALKQRILTCSYEMPTNIPEVAQDIIKKLLVLQPDQRLGGVLVNDHLQRQDVVESYKKLKSHPFFEGINWETLYESEAPQTAEHFIRKGIKKQTAPPLQNINLQEKAELIKTQQSQKKKQSEDLHDIQKSSDQSPLSNSPKVIFEKILQEKQWKLLKVSKLVQIQEDDKFFTINVFEPNKKTSKYSLVVDEHTSIQQKDQKVIVNNGKIKKSYIDYKDAKVSDFYNCLVSGIQKKFQKKSE